MFLKRSAFRDNLLRNVGFVVGEIETRSRRRFGVEGFADQINARFD